MFGKKAKRIAEQSEKIKELEAKIAELTEKNGKLTEQVEAFFARETAIARAMTDAAMQADKVVADAQREAGEILEQSQTDAENARKDAEQIVDSAYQNARDIVKDAEAESQKKLDETQAQINDYAILLTSYDKLVQENIKTAEESARRFAELAGQLHAAIPQILSADGKLIEAPADRNVEAPEQPEATELSREENAETGTEMPVNADEPEENEIPIHIISPQRHDEARTEAADGESGEKLWTVSEVTKNDEDEPAEVDAIINDILGSVHGN